jgi:hypothetical protein
MWPDPRAETDRRVLPLRREAPGKLDRPAALPGSPARQCISGIVGIRERSSRAPIARGYGDYIPRHLPAGRPVHSRLLRGTD